MFRNADEIKQAVCDGNRVFWKHEGYEVVCDNVGQWLIKCHMNDHCIGLTHRDNVTMNANFEDFYMLSPTDTPDIENFYVYVVMWNLPGWLPQMEPHVCNTVEEARNSLLEEVECAMYACDDEDDTTMWHNMWHMIADTPAHDIPNKWVGPNGYVYSISMDWEK